MVHSSEGLDTRAEKGCRRVARPRPRTGSEDSILCLTRSQWRVRVPLAISDPFPSSTCVVGSIERLPSRKLRRSSLPPEAFRQDKQAPAWHAVQRGFRCAVVHVHARGICWQGAQTKSRERRVRRDLSSARSTTARTRFHDDAPLRRPARGEVRGGLADAERRGRVFGRHGAHDGAARAAQAGERHRERGAAAFVVDDQRGIVQDGDNLRKKSQPTRREESVVGEERWVSAGAESTHGDGAWRPGRSRGG